MGANHVLYILMSPLSIQFLQSSHRADTKELLEERMDAWIVGWMDGRTDGWTDGWRQLA